MFEVGYSKVKAYRRCPRQYFYKYVRNLQRKNPAPPLLRGTILHEMLDARALAAMSKPTKTPASILREYQVKYSQLFLEEREKYGETFIEDISRVWANYERTYAGDKLKYEASEELVETELAKGIVYKGTIDKRVTKDGLRFILDHKSHRTIPDEEHRFNNYQILLYLWAYNREASKDKQAVGLIWDYLRTKPPTIPEQLKNGGLTQRANLDTDYETYAHELRRLQLDTAPYREYLDGLKKRSTTRFFVRISLPEPSKEMTESVVTDFTQTATIMHHLKVYPRTMITDCSWCEFFRLCSSDLRGLDSAFIEKTEFEEKAIEEEHAEET